MVAISNDELSARLTTAHAFLLAGRRCWAIHDECAGRTQLVTPTVVALSLSAELYLKLLIVLTGGNYGKTHSLTKLLETLPRPIQDKISQNCRATAEDTGHLHGILSATSDDFVQWRYAHEHDLLCGSPTELDQVCEALHETAKQLSPDLVSQFEMAPRV
jgi:hypothetical protein